MSENVKKNRILVGKVVSDKRVDTITILVERRVKHAKYGKIIRRSSKIHAHDKGNQCRLGDIVKIRECRPISKTKSWTLVEVMERAAN